MPGPTSTYVKNPMTDLYNVVPILRPGGTKYCTDPSFNYSTQCKTGSQSSKSPISSPHHCNYQIVPPPPNGESINGGFLQPSTFDSNFVRNSDSTFNVKPGSGDPVPFTTKNTPNLQDGAQKSYPRSLLFCLDPEPTPQHTADVTQPVNSIKYTNSNFGSSWTDPGTKNTTTNLGFQTS